MSPSRTVNEILSLLSKNLQSSRNTSYNSLGGNIMIMHALVLLCSSQQTK